jgi:hypothetical protein
MPKYDGTDGEQVSSFIIQSRQLLREYYKSMQSGKVANSRSYIFPVTLPAQAQFRTTRRIDGLSTLSTGQDGRLDAASIGLAPDWRKPGPIWEIPYGSLVPQKITNLLAAGRCISADGDAWEVLRVIPPAAHTGQVAGIAASLSIRNNITPDALSYEDIQEQLNLKNIPYHIKDVL